MHRFDIIVIGTGPAGQRAAIQAAKLGRSVVAIERRRVLGGVCVNGGTIPSKTLREAVLDLSGYRRRIFAQQPDSVGLTVTLGGLLQRLASVVAEERRLIRHQLTRNGVEVVIGMARFLDPHSVLIQSEEGDEAFQADRVILATGTVPHRPSHLPFDDGCVFDSDTILTLPRLPRSLTILGAGVIGCEYACIFAQAGLRVTLIDERKDLLSFLDREVADVLARQMTHDGVRLLLGETVQEVESNPPSGVTVRLESGRAIFAQALLSAVGRRAATADLALDCVGLPTDAQGRLQVNEHFQTSVPHLYAAGDVIGFPSLAATSAEQGRLAACHACDVSEPYLPQRFPYGLYTIPEVSFVGPTEEQLQTNGVTYVSGRAWYRELARGQILGDREGLLKLLVSPEDGRLLAVHAIGDGATELIHIGQAVLSFGGDVEYFIRSVFNYPTLAEAYKVAAFDVRNRHLSHRNDSEGFRASSNGNLSLTFSQANADTVARELYPTLSPSTGSERGPVSRTQHKKRRNQIIAVRAAGRRNANGQKPIS